MGDSLCEVFHRNPPARSRDEIIPARPDADRRYRDGVFHERPLPELDSDFGGDLFEACQSVLREDNFCRMLGELSVIFIPAVPAALAAEPPSAKASIVNISSESSGSSSGQRAFRDWRPTVTESGRVVSPPLRVPQPLSLFLSKNRGRSLRQSWQLR